MKKISALIGILLCAAIGTAALIATQTNINHISIEYVEFQAYIDNILLPDANTIEWGTQSTGTITKELAVNATGNIPTKITLFVIGLPTGWELSWPANNTVTTLTETWANATLSLTVPSSAAGAYQWTTTIQAVKP